MIRRLLYSVAVALIASAPLAAQQPAAGSGAGWIVEVEGGPVWQSYNNVEIPNDGTATRFSLHDLVGAGPWPAGRI